MRLLIDTHAFLWFVAGDKRLTRTARRAIEHDEAEIHLSAASVWEMAIKASLGRLTLPLSVSEFVADKLGTGMRVLSVDWQHGAAVERLPFHHRDPFDRVLVAQAQVERLAIVTGDRVFRGYGVEIVW
ncbi:MAG: PIN domain nuclease [Acidobacteria bacterium]|nr:PIN domain nuclease [Acidobacteriota bacterium]